MVKGLVKGALYACPVCSKWRPYRGFEGDDGIGVHIMRSHRRHPLAKDVRVVRAYLGYKDEPPAAALARRYARPAAVLILAAGLVVGLLG